MPGDGTGVVGVFFCPARGETVAMELTWRSLDDTAAAAARLASACTAGDAVGLVGDLGAGKTHFVIALAAALGIPPEVRVTSPTFALVNEYRGGRVPLYHADLYRIERESELDEIGIDDLIRRGDGLAVIEWSDRYRVLPLDHLLLSLRGNGDGPRRVTITASGPRSTILAAAVLGQSA